MKISHEVIIIGGGWSGVSAALAAKKAGADTALCERTDMLLGAGLVGGIMRNNGRFVAAEECIAMGCGDLFELTDSISRHRNIDFPGHRHASLYDVHLAEPAVRALLVKHGITLYMQKRITRAKHQDGRLLEVESDDGNIFQAGAFVDATGSSGPQGMCQRLGNGCASCIQRCPSFGPRVSIARLMGLPEYMTSRRQDIPGGAMSGSCKIYKETLAQSLREKLDAEGVVILPVPRNMVNHSKLDSKVCQQYALPEYAESLVLLDTGHAKLMTSYFPLEHRGRSQVWKRKVCRSSRREQGNHAAYSDSTKRLTMLATGAEPVRCGRKGRICVGHTEAIVTGAAGRNAALLSKKKPLTLIPGTLATGDFIAFSDQ